MNSEFWILCQNQGAVSAEPRDPTATAVAGTSGEAGVQPVGRNLDNVGVPKPEGGGDALKQSTVGVPTPEGQVRKEVVPNDGLNMEA